MINIILAAGEGKRFKNYNLPKLLLKVKNKPLFERAANSLPKKNEFIFVFKKKNYEKNKVIKNIIKKFTNSKVFLINKTTKGQASTLYKIRNIVKQNSPILVTSTDLCFSYNQSTLKKYISNEKNIIFVGNPSKEMKRNPNQFGWVRTDKNNNILKISCKIKIKGNSKNDKVILGAFAFSSFKIFLEGYKNMLKKKVKVNNEYYLDLLMNETKIKKKTKIIKVKKFINWGTPIEYEKNKNKIIK